MPTLQATRAKARRAPSKRTHPPFPRGARAETVLGFGPARMTGRFSDSERYGREAVFLLSVASQLLLMKERPVHGTEVVLVTAAGQLRSFAGFPFKPERMPRRQSRTTTYRASRVQVNTRCCGWPIVKASAGLVPDGPGSARMRSEPAAGSSAALPPKKRPEGHEPRQRSRAGRAALRSATLRICRGRSPSWPGRLESRPSVRPLTIG